MLLILKLVLTMKVGIIDYGSGNLKSIYNFLFNNFTSNICTYTDSSAGLDTCNVIILPGVGHFGHALKKKQGVKKQSPCKYFSKTNEKAYTSICATARKQANNKQQKHGVNTNHSCQTHRKNIYFAASNQIT